MPAPLIHLPIETKSREFDARCLIALECLRAGADVVIGPAEAFPFDCPHAVLLKSAAGFELDRIEATRRRGALCAVLDEEGIVHTHNTKEHALRYAQTTLDAVDRVLLNGPHELDVLREHYRLPEAKCAVTGNPRFDFYKPALAEYFAPQAQALRARFGDYLLITSRFGEVNPARQVGYLDFLKHTRELNLDADIPIFERFFAHSQRLFADFLALVPELGRAFPERRIVVRPHPSERHQTWIDAAAGLQNVHVLAEGAIGPWLHGASAVVHNGCTTGLEAFLMGRPVFAYTPRERSEFDLDLPNDVSVRCDSVPELLACLRRCLAAPGDQCAEGGQGSRLAIAQQHLANAGDTYAYEAIAAELLALAARAPRPSADPRQLPVPRRLRRRLSHVARRLVSGIAGWGLPLPRTLQNLHYGFKKNPGFSGHELSANLERLAQLRGVPLPRIRLHRVDAVNHLLQVNTA